MTRVKNAEFSRFTIDTQRRKMQEEKQMFWIKGHYCALDQNKEWLSTLYTPELLIENKFIEQPGVYILGISIILPPPI